MMVTPEKCPQCGADLQPGAEICTACGHKLTAEEMTAPPAPSSPPPPPPSSPAPAPAAAGTSIDVAAMMNDFRSRWGVEQSPVFTAALVLVAVAFVVGTFSVISWLTAGDGDFRQQENATVSFLFALIAALGATGLLAYLRLEAGGLRGEPHQLDQRIFYGIVGWSIVFILLSMFKGLDESLDAEGAWHHYALLYAFFALGFGLIARPTPSAVGGLAAQAIAFGAVAVAMIFGVIGLIQGRSNDFSTFSMGVSLLDAGYVLVALSLAWFLGMRKAES